MKTKRAAPDEPSEIEAELLALTGSRANYEALLADIGEQLRVIAKSGHRIVMKGNKVVEVTMPKTKTRRKQSQAK